jgi:hypothetical protein
MRTSRTYGVAAALLGAALVAAALVATFASPARPAVGMSMHGMAMPSSTTESYSPALIRQLALARAGTAKYVNDLALAKHDGYSIITKMIPNMGYHFLNGKVTGFDVTKPAILVYEHNGSKWQLGALEWVWPTKPAKAPLPGATYGSFPAACHYADGTFVPAATQDACAKTAPGSNAAFTFWHPDLVTMHVWVWHPNPSGLFSGMNPLAAAYNKG